MCLVLCEPRSERKKNWLYRKWEGLVKWEQKDNRDTPNNAHPNDTEIRFNFNLSSALLINNRKIRAGVFKEALECQFSVEIEAPHWNPLYEPSTHILIYFIVFKIRFVHDDYRYFCEPSRTVFFHLRFFPSHRSSLLELMKEFLFRVCFCRVFFLLHVCNHFVAFDSNRSEMF